MNTPPILVVAHAGTVILRAGQNLQRPSMQSRLYPGLQDVSHVDGRGGRGAEMGVSGYSPEEEDMRGVFMARGPGEGMCKGVRNAPFIKI